MMNRAQQLQDGGTMMLLPPAADRCQECATAHDPEHPHNAQSLYYQTAFQMEHGRPATWLDAMAHCQERVQAVWKAALIERGIDVDAGQVNPPRGAR